MIIWAVIAILIVLADQVVKFTVVNTISLQESVSVIPNILEFVYVKNTGAAFSILNNMTWLLGLLSVLFCIGAVIYWIRKKPAHPLLCTSIVLLFSGALGNAIDRVFRQYVVDFIKLTFIDFPVFNIADIAITVGAALIVIYVLFFDKEKQPEQIK